MAEEKEHIRHFLAENGARTKGGKLHGRSFVTRMLSNPIHYGHFFYAGEIHEGKHEAIITKRLFDDVQAVMNRRFRWSPAERKTAPKALTGLLCCGECGAAITAEVQKGHTYYRCTKKNKAQRCGQPYVREEALAGQITDLLSPFSLREDFAQAMLARLETDKKESAQAGLALAAEKRAEVGKINLRLQKLLDAFLDGIVERDAYVAEKVTLMGRKKALEEQSTALSRGRNTWLEPFRTWIHEAHAAGKIVESGTLPEKKALAVKIFGSNLVLDCKKASGSAVKPWSLLTERTLCFDMAEGEGFEPPVSLRPQRFSRPPR